MVQLILRIFSYLHPKSRVGAGQLLILLKIHILASQIEMFMREGAPSCLCIDSVRTGWHAPSNTKMLAFKHHWKVRFMPAWRCWSENKKPMKRLQSTQLPILLGDHRTSHDLLQYNMTLHSMLTFMTVIYLDSQAWAKSYRHISLYSSAQAHETKGFNSTGWDYRTKKPTDCN